MLRGLRELLSSFLAISLFFSTSSYSFADEKQEAKEDSRASLVEKVVGIKEANAMPPAPYATAATQMQINPLFISYINQPIKSYEKKFNREYFEKTIFKAYYTVDDKKDKIEEKMMEKINRSKWKERAGIDKISTKFSDDDLKLQIKIKERKEKPKSIFGKILYMTVGRLDKIVWKVDYEADMAELRAVNEF